MRIIGNIDHPVFKITVFKMDNRLSVKIEKNMFEQTYRFREGQGVETVQDVEKFLDHFFLQEANDIFAQMDHARLKRLAEIKASGQEDEFDEII